MQPVLSTFLSSVLTGKHVHSTNTLWLGGDPRKHLQENGEVSQNRVSTSSLPQRQSLEHNLSRLSHMGQGSWGMDSPRPRECWLHAVPSSLMFTWARWALIARRISKDFQQVNGSADKDITLITYPYHSFSSAERV